MTNLNPTLEDLREQNEFLQRRVRHLEREVAAMQPVVSEVRRLRIWDFSPYEVCLMIRGWRWIATAPPP